MSRRTPWERLVEHFADGRTPCNCGEAYYTNCGWALIPKPDGTYIEVHDHPACESGCSANQRRARDWIALRMAKSLGLEI